MNMMNLINQFGQFMNNPTKFIPQEYLNDPNAAIQQLMNSGKLTQDQYTQACNMAKQIQSNPMFMRMFGKK
jgi:hypothetical protein